MKKKIYKALSIFLTIMIVFSACFCVFSTVSAAAEEAIYVVSSSGNDSSGDGSTPRKALKTVGKAIELANAAGLKEGDTVTVRVYDTEPVSWVASGVNVPAYSFKLIIKSYSSNATVGKGTDINMGGDVYFENIKVDFGTEEKVFCANGHTVSFPTSVTFVGDGTMVAYAAGSFAAAQGTAINKPVSFENTYPFSKFFLAAYTGDTTFNEDVKISYTSATAPTFYLTGKNGTTTYNKALNLTVSATTASTYALAENSTLAFGTDAYMQIYNVSGYSIDPAASDLSKVPADKLYVINNISGNSKLLELTDTKGVYKVKVKSPDHKVIAKNIVTGVETPYDNTNFTLTLEPGVYDVRLERGPIYENYYVDYEEGMTVVAGTRPDGAGTEAMPVKTYADAARLIAQDGMAEIDVATVVIPSGLTCYWGSDAPELECQVIITSKMAGEPGTLSKSASIEVNADITLKNVKLDIPSSFTEHRALRLHGHNFTVEDDASASVNYVYLMENNNSGVVQENDQTIIANGTLLANYIDFGSFYGYNTFKGDIKIIYDDPSSYLQVRFGSGQDVATTKNVYEGDIDIILKSASDFSMAIRNKAGADIKGKLNVIVDDSVSTTYNFKEKFLKEFSPEGGMWYINNNAADFDFVEFTDEKGKLSVKDGATAYTRQADKDQVTHTGGTIDLSAAPGVYTVSDKAIDPILPEDPHKMLYFRTSGGVHLLTSLARVDPGETYRFEYSIYTSLYEDSAPTFRTNGDKLALVTPKIISEEKIGDYYRIVCEGTIPSTYSMSIYSHFCVLLPSYAEGIIFDRKVYNVKNPEKNLYEGNPDFHDGLNYVMLDTAYFGVHFTGTKGGIDRTRWQNGTQTLEVMDFDESYIKYLMNLNNPNDGEWWNKDDILTEQEFVTYGSAKGTFVDQNGKAVKGTKFLLVSDDNSYSAVTNAKGKFDFGKVVSGFYELFIQDGEGRIRTGFDAFIAQNDEVEFKVVTDTSGVLVDTNVEDNTQQDTDFETNTNDETVDVIVASGGLQGTVYTPNLETVSNLKLVLDGVGDVVTDKDGKFGFANIPVGEYELYAVNSDGSKYVFAKYEIKENINLDVKLKYEPNIDDVVEQEDNGWIIWVIVASVVALLVVAALVFFLVIKKKKN